MRSTFATASLVVSLLVVLFLPGLTLSPVVEATASEGAAPVSPEEPLASPRARAAGSRWVAPALPSLRTGQWEDALRVVDSSAAPGDDDERGRADLLRGILLLRTGRSAEAVDLLEAGARWAEATRSPLRARAFFHLGEAHEALGHGRSAAKAFESAAEGDAAGALTPWVRLRLGEALADAGEAAAALEALRPLLLAPPPSEAALPPTGGGRAADSADLKERTELRLTALAIALPIAAEHDGVLASRLRKALLVEFPCSDPGRELASNEPLGSPEQRLALLGPEALAQRCEALVGDGCETEAIADLGALLASKPVSPLDDRAELLMGRALRGDGQPKKALDHFKRVGPADPQLVSRATHEAAAANKSLGKKAEQRRLLRACAEGPASPWRDKAANALAADESEAGRLSAARDLWRRIAADSTDPSARVQAAWRAAWSQYRAGLETAALASFESLAAGSPTRREAAAARYWAARIVGRRGKTEDAHARLVALAADFPRDYYGLVAADEAGLPRTEGDACVALSLDDALAESLRRLSLADASTAAVAFELLRLGLVDDALQELRHARVGDDATPALARDESRTLALAIAGRRVAALRTFREAVPDWRSRGDLSGAVWCAVYPLAYDDIVLANCAERGLDPALVCGLIHQESVFEPAAVSWVGARGLMQVMPATGRTIARWFDEKVTTDQLVDPERNVRYGTEYLARLLDEFGHPEIALAGYNAGGGRAKRWWKQVGGKDIPLFVESIPFDETREYVKAIIWSSRLYRSAWAGAIEPSPALPESAPTPGPALATR